MKQLLSLFAFMLTMLFANAQQRPMHRKGAMPPPPPPMEERMSKEKRAQLESFKIQFITKKLNLTPEEAEKFWPIYNEQKDATRKLMQERKEDEIALQEAMLVIRKKYKKDLTPVLKSEDRVNLALKVDRELLNKMRNEMMRRKRPPMQ
jgi:Spy/CpxP family protein refolding chaperone